MTTTINELDKRLKILEAQAGLSNHVNKIYPDPAGMVYDPTNRQIHQVYNPAPMAAHTRPRIHDKGTCHDVWSAIS